MSTYRESMIFMNNKVVDAGFVFRFVVLLLRHIMKKYNICTYQHINNNNKNKRKIVILLFHNYRFFCNITNLGCVCNALLSFEHYGNRSKLSLKRKTT